MTYKKPTLDERWAQVMGPKGQSLGKKKPTGTVKDVEHLAELWRQCPGRELVFFERTAGWWGKSSDSAKKALWDAAMRLLPSDRTVVGERVLDEIATARQDTGHLTRLLYSRDGRPRTPEGSLACWKILQHWMGRGGQAKEISLVGVLEDMAWQGTWEWARSGHAELLDAVLLDATRRGLEQPVEKATTHWMGMVFDDAPVRGLEDALDVLLRAGADFRARTAESRQEGKGKISPLERLVQPMREHHPNLQQRANREKAINALLDRGVDWQGVKLGRAEPAVRTQIMTHPAYLRQKLEQVAAGQREVAVGGTKAKPRF